MSGAQTLDLPHVSPTLYGPLPTELTGRRFALFSAALWTQAKDCELCQTKGHNLKHRVFQLQPMADSRGSLQSSRTTLNDFMEPQLIVSAQM